MFLIPSRITPVWHLKYDNQLLVYTHYTTHTHYTQHYIYSKWSYSQCLESDSTCSVCSHSLISYRQASLLSLNPVCCGNAISGEGEGEGRGRKEREKGEGGGRRGRRKERSKEQHLIIIERIYMYTSAYYK